MNGRTATERSGAAAAALDASIVAGGAPPGI
jgi:hypothetical protein